MPPTYDKSDLFEPFVAEVCCLSRVFATSVCLLVEEDTTVPSRSEIWLSVAPNIYGCLHDALLSEIYSIVCRLTDNDNSMGRSDKPNLTLSRVINDLGPAAGTPERKRVENEMARLKPIAEEMKKHRNKVLSHASLDEALAPMTQRNSLDLKAVEEAVRCIKEIANVVADFHQPGIQPVFDPKDIVVESDRIFAALRIAYVPAQG